MHALCGLQTQNSGQSFHHALFADNTGSICAQHSFKVFGRIVEEQEHITTCVDSGRKHIRSLHAVGHTNHVGRIGDDHTVEAQFAAEQIGHDVLVQGSGHNGVRSNFRIDFCHIFGHQNVTAHNSIQAAINQSLVHMSIRCHPVIVTKVVDVIGKMRIAVILTVAGEVLRTAEYTVGFMQTIHICFAHIRYHLGIIAIGTEEDFFTFPVVSDVNNGSECHVAAGCFDLSTGYATHSLCILSFTGGTNLDLGCDGSAVYTNTIAAFFRITCNKYGNFCMLLQNTILIQNHLTGHCVVAATTQMILFHQFLQVFFGITGGQLPEQLTHFFLGSHRCNGGFHPGNITVRKVIGLCF